MKVVLISTDESIIGMGVKTLSACLIAQGFETVIVLMPTKDEKFTGFNWVDLKKICRDAKLVGISCMTHGVQKSMAIKSVIEKEFKGPIVVGGIHASLSAKDMLGNFDLVCQGEGEDVIVELAKRLANNEPYYDIPGLWVKCADNIISNQNRPLKLNLNDYPFPDYDLSHQFILEGNRLVPMVPISTHISFDNFVVLGSRGCPHSCAYCCNQSIKEEFPWLKKVRHYSVDRLIDHLKEISRLYPEVRSFWIEDDTFFAKKLEEIQEFSERYKKEICKPFLILISPWTFSDDKVKCLVDAGLQGLIMGVQSGSENVNYNIYDRNLSNEKIMDIARQLNKYSDMSVYYDFIGMNPFETEDDLINTIKFIRWLPDPFFVFNNNLAFYPGTKIYKRAFNAGIDVSSRIKHGDADIGYKIMKNENIKHKLFHFILLRMAGRVSKFRVGMVARFLISDRFLQFYRFLDSRLSFVIDKIIAVFCMVLIYITLWKRILRKILGPKILLKIRTIRSILSNTFSIHYFRKKR